MRRLVPLLVLFLPASPSPLNAQAPVPQATATPPAQTAPPPADTPYSLSTQSNLVFVPTEVRTKKGEIIFGLKASQFLVEDSGHPQRIHLEEDLGNDGLSLVVVAQCSGAAAEELQKLRGLPTMLDALTGGAPHEIAVVTYGDDPTLVGDFTSDPNVLSTGLAEIKPCDETHVRTFDAVAYANTLLDRRPASMRHAILLLSETRDHGSHTDAKQLIATLGRSNTVVDAVAFSPGRDEVLEELKHGGGGGIVELFFLAINSLRKNAAHELAILSGGEYSNFTSQKGFDQALNRLANRIHNFYNLSFQPSPSSTEPGFHPLRVTVPDYPDAVIRARGSYWSGSLPSANAPDPTPPDPSSPPAPAPAPSGSAPAP